MKYYVTADVHGFYSIMRSALEDAGYFTDQEPHRLLVLGDLFDRGEEAKKMQEFILDLMEKDEVILIRGNHEDLFEEFVIKDDGRSYAHHRSNGTYSTALQLTGFDPEIARREHHRLAILSQQTPYYKRIIPATRDYYETENYVFLHVWIPRSVDGSEYYEFDPDWRTADLIRWEKARWINGIRAARFTKEKKTIVCGHWHTSFGHAFYEDKGSEDGPDADFSPYYAPGIIAIDACTAFSKKVNVIVIEDNEMPA